MAVEHKDLKDVVAQLKNASKMHLGQAKTISQHIKDMAKGAGKATSAFKMKTPAMFNKALRKAAAEGKLDDNPKFKAAVESVAKKKLSASCKAAARRKFDVYPSAYANIWASKQQKKGKC
jgi:hypothetical protein